MDEILNTNEIEQLKQFRLSTEEKLSELSIRLNVLLDNGILLRYLENAGSRIGSPNLKVTASIFVKRYAFLAVIYLYGMTVWNKKLTVSFHNISIQTDSAEDLWLPKFYFHHMKIEKASENRYEWRKEALLELFAENIHVLIGRLSTATKAPRLVLWENISVYVFWLYQNVLAKFEDKEIQERASADFHYLVHEAPGRLFGDEDDNPLQELYERGQAGHPANGHVRTTCCFSYLLESTAKHCTSCPFER